MKIANKSIEPGSREWVLRTSLHRWPLSFVWGLCNMLHVLCSLAFPVLLRYQFVIMFNYDIVDFFMA